MRINTDCASVEPAENPHGLGQKPAVLNVDMPIRFQFSAWNVQKLPSCCYVMGNLDSKSQAWK